MSGDHAHLLTSDLIQVIGSRGEPLPGATTVIKAHGLVQGGRAIVRGPNTIRLLWNSKEFGPYILRRDRYICQYCGGPGHTIEHLLPRSRGGLSTPANCRCACSHCNVTKADRTLREFRDYIYALPCACRMGRTCYKHRVMECLGPLLEAYQGLPQPDSRPVHAPEFRSPRSRKRRRSRRRHSAAACVSCRAK